MATTSLVAIQNIVTSVNTEMGLGPFFFVSTENDVSVLIEKQLIAHGYELIEAEHVRTRQLWRIFIDRPESRSGVDCITFDDCSAVSNLVEDLLIAANIDYEYLEVSSPGLDRVLTKPDHFIRFAGETVKLSLQPAFEGRKKMQGELIGFNNDSVLLSVSGRDTQIPYIQVSRARVVPKF